MDISNFLREVKQYGENSNNIVSIVLVGSYARGEERSDSDIDLVIITENPDELIDAEMFASRFGKTVKIEKEYWGRVTSLRTWYENGMEVEFGITTPIWYSKPIDAGTFRTLNDGYKVIVDKRNSFDNII